MSAHHEEPALPPVEDWAPEPPVVPTAAGGEAPAWSAKPRRLKRLGLLLVLAAVLSVLMDLVYHKHVHEGDIGRAEGLFGFFGIYAFLSCVVLVLLAKVLRLFVRRPEDHYDA